MLGITEQAVGFRAEPRPDQQEHPSAPLPHLADAGPIQNFEDKGADFVRAGNITDLVAGMNGLVGNNLLKPADVQRQIEARDREMDDNYSKDAQVMGIRRTVRGGRSRRLRRRWDARLPSLEGTFLGGCLFSGRQAGRAAAAETA
jgi:predicted oxidoreductase